MLVTNFLRRTGQLCAALLVAGCAPGSQAIFETTKVVWTRSDATEKLPSNPAYRQLRVMFQGQQAFLVLGYLEAAPQGEIEVWYSNKGEVVRLQQGRIVGTAGLPSDWSQVRYDAYPAWSSIDTPARPAPLRLQRIHDEAGRYRIGIIDTLTVRRIPVPAESGLSGGIDAARLTWFEEQPLSGPALSMPASRFAVDMAGTHGAQMAQVVYAEQCLSPVACLTWQRWPVASQTLPLQQ